MKTIFISDVHLSPSHPDSLQAFNTFLSQQCQEGMEALYILGDLFEAYIADDESAFVKEVAANIKKASENASARIYLMRGNRDFLMGKRFAHMCHATLLPDPVVIDLYGEKTLLTHGDEFCTKDISYQRYRQVIQHPVIKWFVLLVPLYFRRKIAEILRRKSSKHTRQYADSEKMDVSLDAIKTAVEKYQVKQIIHGHTHKPAFHEALGIKRWVLPDWRPLGGMVYVLPSKPPQLVIKDEIQL